VQFPSSSNSKRARNGGDKIKQISRNKCLKQYSQEKVIISSSAVE
jgi:hypothetical protein